MYLRRHLHEPYTLGYIRFAHLPKAIKITPLWGYPLSLMDSILSELFYDSTFRLFDYSTFLPFYLSPFPDSSRLFNFSHILTIQLFDSKNKRGTALCTSCNYSLLIINYQLSFPLFAFLLSKLKINMLYLCFD